ncbi:hypothetical protein [Siminovitchia sp. 179-K 8D1 HS]
MNNVRSKARITALGTYVPEKRLTNEEGVNISVIALHEKMTLLQDFH